MKMNDLPATLAAMPGAECAASTNPARAAAIEDYAPALVCVDGPRLASQSCPQEALRAIEDPLPSGLREHPALFVPYLVAMNTMNFQFWDVLPDGSFARYALGGKVGALAMQDAFLAAWQDAMGASWMSDPLERSLHAATLLRVGIGANGIGQLFGDIPAAALRRELLLEALDADRLRQASTWLIERCQQKLALNWRDAFQLATLFPKAYGDRYLKKAQLTLMFIAGQWAGLTGETVALDVTAAADYQLPKVLRSMGLLVYGDALAAAVDNGVLIAADSREERAIRAATIIACEHLARHFGCTVPQVDFWLWLNRNAARDAKFHLTRTTAY